MSYISLIKGAGLQVTSWWESGAWSSTCYRNVPGITLLEEESDSKYDAPLKKHPSKKSPLTKTNFKNQWEKFSENVVEITKTNEQNFVFLLKKKAAHEGQNHIYQEGRSMIYQEVTLTGTR